jgi:hypothetical protein
MVWLDGLESSPFCDVIYFFRSGVESILGRHPFFLFSSGTIFVGSRLSVVQRLSLRPNIYGIGGHYGTYVTDCRSLVRISLGKVEEFRCCSGFFRQNLFVSRSTENETLDYLRCSFLVSCMRSTPVASLRGCSLPHPTHNTHTQAQTKRKPQHPNTHHDTTTCINNNNNNNNNRLQQQ